MKTITTPDVLQPQSESIRQFIAEMYRHSLGLPTRLYERDSDIHRQQIAPAIPWTDSPPRSEVTAHNAPPDSTPYKQRKSKRATPSTMLLWSAPNWTGEARPAGAVNVQLESAGLDSDALDQLANLGFDWKYLDTFPRSHFGRQLAEAWMFSGVEIHIPRHTFRISDEVFDAVIQESPYHAPEDVESLRRVLVMCEPVQDVANETGIPYQRFKKRVQRVRARAELLAEHLVEDVPAENPEEPLVEEKWVRWRWRHKSSVERNGLWVDVREQRPSYPWGGVSSPKLNRAPWPEWNSGGILVPQLEMDALQERQTRKHSGRVTPGGAGPDADEWDEAAAYGDRTKD